MGSSGGGELLDPVDGKETSGPSPGINQTWRGGDEREDKGEQMGEGWIREERPSACPRQWEQGMGNSC